MENTKSCKTRNNHKLCCKCKEESPVKVPKTFAGDVVYLDKTLGEILEEIIEKIDNSE